MIVKRDQPVCKYGIKFSFMKELEIAVAVLLLFLLHFGPLNILLSVFVLALFSI